MIPGKPVCHKNPFVIPVERKRQPVVAPLLVFVDADGALSVKFTGSAAAEKEKRTFFKRIPVVFVFNDHGKSINPFPKINISACQDHTLDAGSIF